MLINKFKGILPALVTPYDNKGELCFRSLRKQMDIAFNKGVQGFYVAGTTGESFLLSPDERVEMMAAAAEAADGRGVLIAHTGCMSTKDTLRLCKEAERLGYDAVSSVPPFYFKYNEAEIKRYYFDMAESSSLPLLVYNIPAMSGVRLSMSAWAELLADERILGLKDTSGDYYNMERLKNLYPDKIIYNGPDEMLLAGLSMGADGGIGSTYNFMAERFVGIYKAFQQRNMESALALQKQANDIIQLLLSVGVFPGIKVILEELGLEAGFCRPPFQPLDPDVREDFVSKLIFDRKGQTVSAK